MSYTVQQLATIAGVSVRTLHYYDEIGFLLPARVAQNGYRYYEEKELLKLQQILFFRELDFPLEEITKILAERNFDMTAALKDQRKLIEIKRNRLKKLVHTIDKTIKKINKETTMEDIELYDAFSKEEAEKYAAEAKERWGHTEAYKQSKERVKKLGPEGMKKVKEESEKLMQDIALCMREGNAVDSKEMQKLIARHYDALRTFYEPNLKMYRGLAEMYVADPRFAAYYEKYEKGLAQYMHDAMIAYVDSHEGK